jgi:hypothetical protein
MQCSKQHPSLDYLIRAGEQGGRDVEAERFGGLEVDDKPEADRKLDRHLARLCALENAIDVAGGLPVTCNEVGVGAVVQQNPGRFEAAGIPPMSTPMRRIGPLCCAPAASGHAAAVPPRSVMNSRRLTSVTGFPSAAGLPRAQPATEGPASLIG